MIELVVLDMAGTTLQDNKEVETCFLKAAQATQIEATEAEILAVQGWSKIEVFEHFWARQLGKKDEEWEQKVQHSYQVFREILENHYHTQPVLATESCLETLAALRERGIKIALTTGFYRKVADVILDKLGWLDGLDEHYIGTAESLIQFSITSDQVEKGRPAPDMIFAAMQALDVQDVKKVIKVGDTPSDLEAGKNAGVLWSLAVTNGTHTEAQLADYPNDGLLAKLYDLIPMIDKLPVSVDSEEVSA